MCTVRAQELRQDLDVRHVFCIMQDESEEDGVMQFPSIWADWVKQSVKKNVGTYDRFIMINLEELIQ